MDKLLTLPEWAERVYGDNPPSLATLRRWARDCRIYPAPERHGRSYYLPASARFRAEASPTETSDHLARFEQPRTEAIAAGRPRSPRNKSLPANLYERSGYYSWRDPQTGREHGLGRDRRSAVEQAIEANLVVEGLQNKRRLVDRLTTGPNNSVGAFCDLYSGIIDSRKEAGRIKKATHEHVSQRSRHLRTALGERRIDSITTRDVADYLTAWEERGKLRMAQSVRAFLLDLFTVAKSKGWVTLNPVTDTKVAPAEVQRARLTLDDFRAIHAVAVKDYAPWLARVMELALVTGQRREDLIAMGPRDVRDGKLWIVPKKTERHSVRICIPLELRLQAVGWSVGEVIARCRDNILSRHFIHHNAHAGRAKPGDPIRRHTVSAWFAEARDKSGRSWPAGNTPPSFHEIRSLAARLYHEQGINAQMLLGHKSPAMTARYCDSRGSEWMEVKPT
ncbi:excisionase [Azospirillum sp. BE72]|uniref:excisionase n=1 Tax=Azospirillum sp. BE72 TaxID=2817776 RepID=UPI002854DD71|nr:tyrosine-type recombinase/integrase [Azospirillum sp. BE72]MDR6770403.1 integrase [Azospirillum sp. BE72]